MAAADDSAAGALLYARLVRLYPRPFRDDYGDAMVQLYGDRLRDELRRGRRLPAARLWAHLAADLVSSILRQRIEALMARHRILTTLGLVVALAVSVAALVAVGISGLLAVVVVLGVLVYRRQRRLAASSGAGHWRLWLAVGVPVLVVGLLPGFLGYDNSWLWLPLMAMILGGGAAVLIGLAKAAASMRMRGSPSSA